jgi:HK97 family phage portal protein
MESPAMSLSSAFNWLMSGSNTTAAGEVINEQIAMQHITVYTCVRILAEAVGSLPLLLYKREAKGRSEALDNPLHRMFSVTPNDEMTASTFWQTIVGSMAAAGNGYCEIERNQAHQPVGLYPLNALSTKPKRVKQTGKIVYEARSGSADGATRYLDAADVLHFPLFSWDGLQGMSPIAQAKNAIGLAVAVEKFGSKFFANGSRPGGVLTPIGDIDEATLNNFRAHWEKSQSGDNQGRVAVLPGDWKYQETGISPEDSQFLQTRQMSRADIAALFRLAPHQVGDTSRLSNNNAEQASLQFVVDSLRPYAVAIEQEIARKLLPVDGSLHCEFDMSARLRGDLKSMMESFAVGKQWGIYSTNTILNKLGENPIGPEGDITWAPVNMQDSKRLLDTEPIQDQPIGGLKPLPPEPGGTPMTPRSFAPLFEDAVGRATTRSKRDLDALTTVFTPVLSTITAQIEVEARSKLSLPAEWHASDKVSREHLKAMVSRSSDWNPENRAKTTDCELKRAFKALYLGIYREAGATLAESQITEDTNE